MAKRPTARTQSDDAGAPAQPRARRSRAAPPPAADADTQTQALQRAPEALPEVAEPGDMADRTRRSESMASEPSEDDIRARAYQRFLERGGTHGGHFDDWVEAERELKKGR